MTGRQCYTRVDAGDKRLQNSRPNPIFNLASGVTNLDRAGSNRRANTRDLPEIRFFTERLRIGHPEVTGADGDWGRIISECATYRKFTRHQSAIEGFGRHGEPFDHPKAQAVFPAASRQLESS